MKKQLKVLIVEDERLTAKSLQLDMERLGAEVLEPVSSGKDAVDVALQEHPDFILMDIRLIGKLDGIDAATEIHSNKKIPIAFMSGYATEFIMERAQKINPVDFLEKPVSIAQLKQIIDQLQADVSSKKN